ncbi:hypothetical protein [Paenibacillus cremeus]|uniref:hypothetical protein n=1 Tax=Paenibacillus cremeus TaxID=2163881 RepID=UPI0021BDBCDE|nr:hypothetical protein [Paenibacillus cremeus]
MLSHWKSWWTEQHGAVSVYFILILIPLFLLCGLLIDVIRWKNASRETEQAVKAGVRSVLSTFSSTLQAYGLYAMEPAADEQSAVFERTVAGNLDVIENEGSFRFIDTKLIPGSARIVPMYSLANHNVLKQQILEEMKYRAPILYGLQIRDTFQKTGLAAQMNQASRFSERAEKVDAMLEERDEQLEKAWKAFEDIYQKAQNLHPFYKTQLRDLNELSGRIGIHTAEEIRNTLQQARNQVKALEDQIRNIDMSMASLAQAGISAADAIMQLNQSRLQLVNQFQTASQLVTEYEQLLNDILRYAQLLTVLKLKSETDFAAVSTLNDSFQEAMKQAIRVNDSLNAELSTEASKSGLAADAVYQNLKLVNRQELEEFGAGVSTAVSLFSGVHAQIQDSLMFTQQKYSSTDSALDLFLQKAVDLYSRQSPLQAEREQKRNDNSAAKKDQRNKTKPI